MGMKIKKSRLQQIIKEEVENYNLDEQGQKMSFVNNILDRVVKVYLEASGGDPEQAKGMLFDAIEDKLEDTSNLKLV